MKLYTSYFGNMKRIYVNGLVPICIARGIPSYYRGLSNQSVAPHSWMLKDSVTRDEYVDAYFNKVLSSVDPKGFVDECENMSNGKDVALLCYEKPSDFCHRHLLAEWLKDKLGIEVKELGVDGEPWKHLNPPAKQLGLFD